MPTTVVHLKREPFDVCIDRTTKWGNPFVIDQDGTREEVVQQYHSWILTQPALLSDLHELKGKRLGCWCNPNLCHGHVLAILADGIAVIDCFKGEYSFLSNFYQSPVFFDGYECKTVEHAYQAAKTNNHVMRRMIIEADLPGTAKRMGKNCPLREDWDQVKSAIMMECLIQKFFIHSDLRQKLINTGSTELIEGNTWGDTYWGVCNDVGENRLGKMLMRIRSMVLRK